MITVRNGSEVDFQLLSTLGRRAFQEAFGKYNDAGDMQAYLDLAFNSDKIKEELLNRSITYYIASYQEIPVGYAKLNIDAVYPDLPVDAQIQLERIYVLDAFTGKKVGKALMEKCIQHAVNIGKEFIWLSVWQQNKKAINFYKKWNFKIIGNKKFVLGKEVNNDFVMALQLLKNNPA